MSDRSMHYARLYHEATLKWPGPRPSLGVWEVWGVPACGDEGTANRTDNPANVTCGRCLVAISAKEKDDE